MQSEIFWLVSTTQISKDIDVRHTALVLVCAPLIFKPSTALNLLIFQQIICILSSLGPLDLTSLASLYKSQRQNFSIPK